MPHAPNSRRPRRVDPDQLKADVLRGLAQGLPLTVVARRNGMTQKQIDRWKQRDPDMAEEIAAARALGWDSLATECLEIIDDRSNDVILDDEGVPHFNSAAVLRDKARVETRLRLLACWDTGRYGPQRTLKIEGEVTTTTRHVVDPRQLDEAGRAGLRALLAQAEAQGLLPAPEDAVDAEFEALGAEEDVADG